MRTVSVLFIILFFSSCTVTGKYFAGDGFNNTSLTLNKDHSFIFIDFHDIGGANKITGQWSLKNRILKLNSDNRPPFVPNSISAVQVKSLSHKLVVIQNMDVSAYKTIVSLNDGAIIDSTNYLPANDLFIDSSFTFLATGFYTNIDTIKSIRILKTNGWTDCGFTQTEFQVNNPNANYIRIFAQPYNHYYGMKYFYNTEWLIKNNKIYNWRQENNEFAKKAYLKKRK